MKPTIHVEENQNPAVTVSKAGVVNINTIYNRDISVNSCSMIDKLEKAIDEMEIRHESDINSLFAGRVTITVEFLGNMIERKNKTVEEMRNEENSHPV